MRTTIEMKPEHRSRVLELAAARGEKGFSSIVRDALELYLRVHSEQTEAVQKALALKGSFTEAEGDRLRAETRRSRENWR